MFLRATPRIVLPALVGLHLVVLLAGFFAPYDFASQNRMLPFAPPTRIHIIDSQGKLHARPFIYQWKATAEGVPQYKEDHSAVFPIRFFVSVPRYEIVGIVGFRWRLFGVETPARIFLLGSDAYGRDQLSRLLYGGQISLFAGPLATVISLSLGILLGATAGYYGSWIDEVLMRFAEVFLALPWLYLLFAVRAFLPMHAGPNQIFILLIVVIGVIGWARPARLIRGIALSAREREYVLAAKSFGASDAYILRRHILPQVSGVALTQAALLIPRYVLAEVTLSFLGLGVAEPAPSWGNMLAALQHYEIIGSYWWMSLPALALIPVFLAYYSLLAYYTVQDSSISEAIWKHREGFRPI
ncbi:MAG: ABC transporter permease [Acidobacteriaceae bacterium]|nr:ABC transporter permease [Acidobacteriaceae bacterium]